MDSQNIINIICLLIAFIIYTEIKRCYKKIESLEKDFRNFRDKDRDELMKKYEERLLADRKLYFAKSKEIREGLTTPVSRDEVTISDDI